MRLLVAVASLLAACGPSVATPSAVRGPPPPPERVDARSDPGVGVGGEPLDAGAQLVGDPIVLVTAAGTLDALEAEGLTAGPIAFGGGDETIASFASGPRWKGLRRQLTDDVQQQQDADPRAGVGMRHSHRLFDVSWLSSDKTRLELVGIVNRADRRPFAPEHCGETRLVYRLAYRTEVDGTPIDSRLPMTINVVFWQDAPSPGGCEAVAHRWIAPPGVEGAELARWLMRGGGPLSVELLRGSSLKSVEINAQVVRWPAVVHPSLGGHAVYVLRVFQPEGAGLVAAPLENVPDVGRLSASPKTRRALLAWIREPKTQQALDEGVAVMPQRFAATQAISVTPHGLGRLGNRPFSQLFDPTDFENLEFRGKHVRSAQGLLRRLDGSSCQGCHETRSVAGFHLLGEPRDPDVVLDTVMVPTSAHLDGDLLRRSAWVRRLAEGGRPDDARPLSDFERVAGEYGAHCGLGDPGFAAWRCTSAYECVELDDPQMGTCLPADSRMAGDPCQFGELRTRAKPSRDRVRNIEERVCADAAVCNKSAVGFPGGMCTKGCGGLREGEACGAIVNLATFNNCVARRKPFTTCIVKAAFEAGMRACDADHRCRDDYICARSPTSVTSGVCLPPYFLFQMRVDGHVL